MCVAVLDEEDNTITAGSIVTVSVNLTRADMGSLFDRDLNLDEKPPEEEGEVDDHVETEEKPTEVKPYAATFPRERCIFVLPCTVVPSSTSVAGDRSPTGC